MKHKKRSQLFVDPKVQGVLLLRAVLYWSFCIIMLTLIMVCWRILTGPSRPLYVHLDYLWFHYKPAAIASTLLLPILIIDMLRVSNRFAGPMVRLRNSMRRLADGDQDVEALHFRKKDFWRDFAADFNRLLERLDKAEHLKDEELAAKESANASVTPQPNANDDEPSAEALALPRAEELVMENAASPLP